jgi:iron complex transport system ATP-binding protein
VTLAAVDVNYGPARQRRLQAVSLTVEPGALHVLLGPNGAGKSTLLRLLAGDLRATHGSITLDQKPLADWPARSLARRRAVMMQRDSLPFPFTVAEVVALGRLPWGDGDGAQDLVREALTRAGADALIDRRYPELSGGERARVQLARSLIQLASKDSSPRYLLLDEPTASLDFAFQHRCLLEVRREVDRGNGALLILQDPLLARRHADRVTLLQAGCVVASGPASSVLAASMLRQVYGIAPEDFEPVQR